MSSSPVQTVCPIYDYQEPSTPPDPTAVYFPGACFKLYAVAPPGVPKDRRCQHDKRSLERQRTEGLYALSLANRIRLPLSPSLSITLSDKLCGGIREHVTHVWTACTSSPTSENVSSIVVAKFYDPLYFHDEYDSIDPLRLAARSVASEVKAYEMLQSFQGISVPRCLGLYATTIPEQDGRTVYVLLLEFVTGKDLRYLSEDGDGEDIMADYLCERHREAMFAPLFQLMMDFRDLGVCQDDLAPRNIIIRPPARPGPFCSNECCPARFEVDIDDVRAVMVDFERVYIEYPPNPEAMKSVRRRFANAVIKDYFTYWFRNICTYPSYRA
ncbi:hypothetical protein F5146DRAFT_1037259 [Armillaria mellea]|nr:hypothetical protein F5146DRAFT_1037259 [Armillaria mellea]